MASINTPLLLDVFNRLDEELEKSHIVLMKKNNLKNLLPVHCYVIWAIDQFITAPIIIDIAQRLYKSKAAVGAIIKTLEKKHYISTIESQKDKRAKQIVLTSKGKKIKKIIADMLNQHNLMVMKNLTTTEKDSLYKLLGKVQQNIRLFNDINDMKVQEE